MLTLHTNNAMKSHMKASCNVKMDDKAESYNEFVVVGSNLGQLEITANADALTLGKSLGLILNAFNETMLKLSVDDQLYVMKQLEASNEDNS